MLTAGRTTGSAGLAAAPKESIGNLQRSQRPQAVVTEPGLSNLQRGSSACLVFMEKTLRSLLSLCVVLAHCAKASPWLEWGRGWESGPGQGEEPPLPGEVTSDSHFRAKFIIFISAAEVSMPRTCLPAVEALREAAALLPPAAPGAEGGFFWRDLRELGAVSPEIQRALCSSCPTHTPEIPVLSMCALSVSVHPFKLHEQSVSESRF